MHNNWCLVHAQYRKLVRVIESLFNLAMIWRKSVIIPGDVDNVRPRIDFFVPASLPAKNSGRNYLHWFIVCNGRFPFVLYPVRARKLRTQLWINGHYEMTRKEVVESWRPWKLPLMSSKRNYLKMPHVYGSAVMILGWRSVTQFLFLLIEKKKDFHPLLVTKSNKLKYCIIIQTKHKKGWFQHCEKLFTCVPFVLQWGGDQNWR